MCSHFQTPQRGGRPPKLVCGHGRPKDGTSTNVIIRMVKEIAPKPITEVEVVQYVTDHPEATCKDCSQVLTQPLELACSHHICCHCLCNQLQQSGQLHCPSCHQELSLVPESVRKPPPLLISLLGGLEERCATCERTVMVKHL